jgi:phosphate transport system substrate-binding protein
MKRNILICFVVWLGIGIAGCNKSTSTLIPIVAPTYTPFPTYTPLPTYTKRPIFTPLTTYTPTPTCLACISRQPVYTFDTPLNKIAQNYPRVDGSTSTQPLQLSITCRIYNLYCPWTWSVERFTIELLPLMFVQDRPYTYQMVPSNIDELPGIHHNGTHEAYLNLINNKVDFILEARLPSADELKLAMENGVELDARAVAMDAFVFLNHADNPVDSLSLRQIQSIYSARITNWSELGGINNPIQAYQRETDSGSQELMKTLVMKGIPMVNAPEMVVLTMAGPVNAIDNNTNGIGYSVYYYMRYITKPDEYIKLLAVNGIRPTSKTIVQKKYPLLSEVYAVVRAQAPKNHPSILLRDWLLTEDGQWTVQSSGYVPVFPLP